MERAALLRSISSSSSLVTSRIFSRTLLRPFSLSNRRTLQNPSFRKPNPRFLLRHFCPISSLSFPSPLPFNGRSFSSHAIATDRSSGLGKQDDVGEKFGFEKVSEQFIEECKSRAVLYKHKKTGAEVMSVCNDDENTVFGIVFRTPPNDSTGIPHILEHSVLCGSRKYPLKEPFVELLKGSLHTFLNAFTYPDRTCYPVASTNTKMFTWMRCSSPCVLRIFGPSSKKAGILSLMTLRKRSRTKVLFLMR